MRFPTLLVAVLLFHALGALQAATTSPQQAAIFENKLQQIALIGESPKTGQVRTPLTEDEINSWLQYAPTVKVPEGVSDPQLTLLGAGRLTGRAIVDLEQVGSRRSAGGVLDPWAMLTGRVPVDVTGILQTANGRGHFQLEQAEVSGITVPNSMLEQIADAYLLEPGGISLDDEFVLPANIRHIEVALGRAVVVQ